MDDAVRSWVLDVLDAHEATDLQSLTFGISSTLRLLEVDGTRLVLRQYERDGLVDHLPNLVEHEASALLAARPVLGDLVPEPIAFDVAGAGTGRPTLLMTYLPGQPVIHGLDPRKLALPLALLHRATCPNAFPAYRPWFARENVAVPAWTTNPDAWSMLVDVIGGPRPEAVDAFLHRDFHPGNLLWNKGTLSGVVDWATSCRGPRGVDVAHARWNLALVDGAVAAEQFLGAYRDLEPAYRHDPWWDIAELFSGDEGFAGVIAFNAFGARLTVELLRARSDQWADALARKL
jgi:aminoglycoside phosphotransferase (APT) family kinase protein